MILYLAGCCPGAQPATIAGLRRLHGHFANTLATYWWVASGVGDSGRVWEYLAAEKRAEVRA